MYSSITINLKADYSSAVEVTASNGKRYEIRYDSDATMRIMMSENPDEDHNALESDITITEVFNWDTMASVHPYCPFIMRLIQDAMPSILRQATDEHLRLISRLSSSMASHSFG